MPRDKVVRSWRFQSAVPYGLHVWFDPETETITIRDLTDSEKTSRVYEYGSVSGLERDGNPDFSLNNNRLPFTRENR